MGLSLNITKKSKAMAVYTQFIVCYIGLPRQGLAMLNAPQIHLCVYMWGVDMLSKLAQKKLHVLVSERNFMRLAVIGLTLNAILQSAQTIETKTILVPTYLSAQTELSNSKIAPNYLIDLSSDFLSALYNQNYDSSDYYKERLKIYLSHEARDEIPLMWAKMNDKLIDAKGDQYIKILSIQENTTDLTTINEITLNTTIKDKVISRQNKKIKLFWIKDSGAIKLRSIEIVE